MKLAYVEGLIGGEAVSVGRAVVPIHEEG